MGDRKLVALAAALLGVALVAYWWLRRAPAVAAERLVAAYVAIERQGSGVAAVGPLDLKAGMEFELHLVVESRDRSGAAFYFTEAPALRLGGRDVEPGALKRWDVDLPVRVLWFTVEPKPPFVAAGSPVPEPRYEEVFRPDWPRAWSVPGRLDPVVENFLPGVDGAVARPRFGSQRFHVRFEVLDDSDAILPRASLRSAGATDAVAEPGTFPTVTSFLPEPLGIPSGVFGSQQIEPDSQPQDVRRAALERISGWMEEALAFSRLTLLDGWLGALGARWEELAWTEVETDASAPFGAPGDLLRAGSRWVILYEDRGEAGRLDGQDLCFDYDRGARVLPLASIFTGDGLLERAPTAGLGRQEG